MLRRALTFLPVRFLESRGIRPTAEAGTVEWRQEVERRKVSIQLGASKLTDYNRLLFRMPKRLKVTARREGVCPVGCRILLLRYGVTVDDPRRDGRHPNADCDVVGYKVRTVQ